MKNVKWKDEICVFSWMKWNSVLIISQSIVSGKTDVRDVVFPSDLPCKQRETDLKGIYQQIKSEIIIWKKKKKRNYTNWQGSTEFVKFVENPLRNFTIYKGKQNTI
jgi:hypothetical protein